MSLLSATISDAMTDATRTPQDAAGLSLSDAAVRLGISPDAARKRLERGTLSGVKREGRWTVYLELDATADNVQDAILDADRTPVDAAADSLLPATRELIEALRSENAFLRSELDVPHRRDPAP